MHDWLWLHTGLLDGKKATSNNNAFEWVKSQSDKPDWIKHARWVEVKVFCRSMQCLLQLKQVGIL